MEEVSENSAEESALPQWLEGIEDRVVEAYRKHGLKPRSMFLGVVDGRCCALGALCYSEIQQNKFSKNKGAAWDVVWETLNAEHGAAWDVVWETLNAKPGDTDLFVWGFDREIDEAAPYNTYINNPFYAAGRRTAQRVKEAGLL